MVHVAAIVLVAGLLLALPPSALGGPVHSPTAQGSLAAIVSPPSLVASSNGHAIGAFPVYNATVATAPPSPQAGVPDSAVLVTPSPSVPPTTPVIENLGANLTGCCLYANFQVPSGGPWGAIVLNYTGEAVGGVFDSSYRAYVDGAQVLFGTTPEYGRWTVLRDLTEYSVLFQGTVNVTFLLSAATTGGYFLSTVSVLFYPLPTGQTPPVEPNAIVPLWNKTYVRSSAPELNRTVTVPSNVTNATLELYTYGFGPDEFWYLQAPGFRDVEVAVDGSTLASVLPFPALNTGGLDLFLWRPVPATNTLDERPYRFDVTGALGLLEGTHNFTASVQGLLGTSDWLVGGNLLLFTSPSAQTASASSYSFVHPAPLIRTDGSTYYDENATVNLTYSARIPTASGTFTASDSVVESYGSGLLSNAHWENLTGTESMAEDASLAGPSSWANSSVRYTFPYGVDLGSYFVETSSTNGTYPIYGNFTSYVLNFHHAWNESGESSYEANGSPSSRLTYSVSNVATANDGVTKGQEELISATAAVLLGIDFISATTTALYTDSFVGTNLTSSWTHLIVASSYQPPGPDQAETITVDEILSPLVAAVRVSPGALDAGGNVTLDAIVSGGYGPFTYRWTGLPRGCTSANVSQLACVPSVPGSYAVTVAVTDLLGESATAPAAQLTVVPALVATLIASPPVADVGTAVDFTVNVTGGVAPFLCTWFINGSLARGPSSCTIPLLTVGTVAAQPLRVSVTVSDRTLAEATASLVVPVATAPSVSLSVPSNASELAMNGSLLLTASVAGGTAPYTYVWYENGSVIPGFNGTAYPFVGLASGTYSFSVTIVDAAGGEAGSSTVTVTVLPAPPPARPAAGVGTSTLYATFAIGAVVGAGVGIGIALLLRRGGRAPRAPPPRGNPGASSPPRSPK